AKRVPTRALMTLVGVLLTITSAYSVYVALTR
ncbi:sulfite exporter TauE/SafE family protein, partial [Escherichia coli]|nr:sulfite exporter TauE/SafE family protein [Escherichia coli]